MPRGGGVFDLEIVSSSEGMVVLQASGKDAERFFEDEAGGHRWQRIPPTEKRGRVHTSTVTVAILRGASEREVRIHDRDLELSFFGAGGPGGQHQNRTASACRIRHRPTGIVVECRSERCQHRNRRTAIGLLRATLKNRNEQASKVKERDERRNQIGTGMRSEKIRTYRERDDRVIDHRSGKKTKLSLLRKGDWSRIK